MFEICKNTPSRNCRKVAVIAFAEAHLLPDPARISRRAHEKGLLHSLENKLQISEILFRYPASLQLDGTPELFRQISYRAAPEPVGDLIQLSSNHKTVCLENGLCVPNIHAARGRY